MSRARRSETRAKQDAKLLALVVAVVSLLEQIRALLVVNPDHKVNKLDEPRSRGTRQAESRT